ncbi:hypothetical protein [Rhizobium sp. BK176]|uniref:hypothetical protein n=1 Tax=Rhizobium sp. BK176 TaxID=2587071 RepID=UPI0021670350|nr:hypothetical protein [Rhizobium sp. BK176]MCS4089722.1 hypothetical protein [Rhizobium sp. BK176]
MAIEYKVNLHRVRNELKEGDLVIVNLDKHRWVGEYRTAETSLGRVIKGGKNNVEIEVADLGVLKGERPGYHSSSLDLKYPNREFLVYAVNQLRTNDEKIVYEYLDRLKAVENLSSAAFHVTAINENGIYGRLIGQNDLSLKSDQSEFTTSDEFDGSSIQIATQGAAEITDVFPARIENLRKSLAQVTPVPDVKAGDILIARHFGFTFEDGTPFVRLLDIAVIGNAENTADAVAFLGLDDLPVEPNHGFASTLSSASQINRDYEIARSRTEPSTALVLFYKDGDEIRNHTLGSSGYTAYVCDDLNIYFDGQVHEPGLYTIHDLAIRGYQSHDGEWDADLEGDFRAATPEDVERLFGTEAIDSEIVAILETDEDPTGIAERYMEMARQAVFDEKFGTEHMVFARHRMGVPAIDARPVPAEDILNPASIDAFLTEHMSAIEPEILREQIVAAMKTEILDRGRVFEEVAPTDEEAEAFASRKTWQSRGKTVVFVPDDALIADTRAVVAAVSANAAALVRKIEAGANYSRSPSIRHLMGKLVQPLVADGLKPFSKARNVDGEWLFVGKHKREVTLALVVDGVHLATLVSSGEKSRLLTRFGMGLTNSSYDVATSIRRHVSVDNQLRDADRAIAEIEARREVYGDYFQPVADGVHELHTSTIHIVDGVMHREDGPAMVRRPRFVGDDAYEEYRFRGNLHRDDGPALVLGDQSVWYRHGLEHRVDGPSALIGQEREYRQYDRLHRDGGPAIESPGLTGWYRHGKEHREDGPALIYRSSQHHYRGGLLHRVGEPAIETDNGFDAYYQNGRLHNPHGPAAVYADETVYAIDGEQMTEQDHQRRTARITASAGPSI